MLCAKCKKNKAIIYYRREQNGAHTQKALCPDCAALEQKEELSINPLAGFFSSCRSGVSEAKRCPVCRASLRDLVQSGSMGCPECYQTFSEELRPVLNSLHGGAAHTGSTPQSPPPACRIYGESERLQSALLEAINRQDYERAAVLRDTLQKIASGGEEQRHGVV